MPTVISSVPNQDMQLYHWLLTFVVPDPHTLDMKVMFFLISETIFMQTLITAKSIKIYMIAIHTLSIVTCTQIVTIYCSISYRNY
jgi:hypothetical protein